MAFENYGVADKNTRKIVSPARPGENGIGPGSPGESHTLISEQKRKRALDTSHLMEQVTERNNLNEAYKRVVANKGAGGIDGMEVCELETWLRENGEALKISLLDGSYMPQPVRKVEIPKKKGGKRQLGIPTVVDRVVQQATLQVLTPIIDPLFSDSSYGFRSGRSAQQAVLKAKEYVEEGRAVVVDVDLANFFDNVNHDILMAKLMKLIEDKRLLQLIRKFLRAGIMANGTCLKKRQRNSARRSPVAITCKRYARPTR